MNWIPKNLVHYLFLFTCALRLAATLGPMLWTFDLLNITASSSNTDIANLELNVIRLGRGRSGFSGVIEFMQPLDDQLHFELSAKRSLKKNGPYTSWPLTFSDNLSTFMNTIYKNLAMPTLAECCINAPVFEGTFVPPISARRIEVKGCAFSIENMPNIMMEGYYWVTVKITNVSGVEVNILYQTYVETEKFL